MTRMRTASICAFVALSLHLSVPTSSYLIGNWWTDSTNIVMDDVFLPAATWSAPAQHQLAEWNEVDVTTNNHPFLINASPQFSFGADDGDNTMGFLGEAGLNSEYGLSYASALAWTVCWSSTRIVECDIMVDPSRPWSLGPDDDEWFQSTVLHEAGHVRGLKHYNSYLSMQNSGGNKKLRAETLYMDDKEAVRQHASHVNEFDIAIYPKWHNGSSAQWMSSPSPTTLRVGDLIQWNNITVENRGTNAFGSLGIGFYMSTNTTISTSDTFLNSGSWGSFGRFTFSTFNWSATVPSVTDCGTRYFGAIIDHTNAWGERFEGNNATPLHDSGPDPQPYTILLSKDSLEPNDSLAGARVVALPFSASNLSIDQDFANDYYRFTLATASQVTATISFTHASGDVDLQLLNSSGSAIATSAGVGNSETVSASVAAGTYYLRVYGFGAGSCNRYSINASATVPSVSVVATDATATEAGPTTGRFRISRTGSTASSLTVSYSVGGSATAGADYASLGSSATIPAGQSFVDRVVTPIADGAAEPPESVLLTLVAGSGYTVGAPGSASVSISDGPDLVISVLNGPGRSGKGATIALNVTTKNNGTGPAGGSRTTVFLSTNNTHDASDVALGTVSVPALAPAATSAAPLSVTIPATTADGNYYLIALADNGNAVAETKENNNTRTRAITIGADLTVSALSAPGSAAAGATIAVNETTKNAAGASPAAASTTRVYLSANNVFDASDTLLASRAVPALAPNATSAFAHTVTIPAGTPASSRFLIVVADAAGAVFENNENNNVRTKAITITP